MTIWNPHHRRQFGGGLRATMAYAVAAVLSIAVWVFLASLMA